MYATSNETRETPGGAGREFVHQPEPDESDADIETWKRQMREPTRFAPSSTLPRARQMVSSCETDARARMDRASAFGRGLVLNPEVGKLDVPVDDRQVQGVRRLFEPSLAVVVSIESGSVGAAVDLLLELVVEHHAIDPTAAILDGRGFHLEHAIERRIVHEFRRLARRGT